MTHSMRNDALAMLLGIGVCVGVSAQTQSSPPPSGSTAAATSPASAPDAKKQKRASRAKTPPGKAPRGTAECNQGDKAQRQRCLNDMYGPGGPKL